MFTRIVVGTDGSSDATEAVKAAARIAQATAGAEVHLVTAYEPLTYSEMDRIDRELPNEFHDLLTEDLIAQTTLEAAAGVLTAHGVTHTTYETRTRAADAILSVAEAVDADLIVVGSRGEGPLTRLVHGSTSTRVLHESPCNVLVVKRPEE